MEGMKKVEILRAACCVAGIDGETTDDERRILEVLAADAGVGSASLNAMIARAESDQAFYKEQFRALKSDPQETMQLLFSVSLVDGRLGSREREVMWRLACRLDVTQEQFDKWVAQAANYLKKKSGTDSL